MTTPVVLVTGALTGIGGGHGVDPDANGGAFEGGGLGEADDGVLGGNVQAGAGEALLAIDGGEVDDAARALTLHDPQLVLQTEHGPQDVVQTAMLDRVTGNDAHAKAAFLGLVPQGRAGDVSEIAEAIVFLTSEQAGFLTGQTIFIDGGFTAA